MHLRCSRQCLLLICVSIQRCFCDFLSKFLDEGKQLPRPSRTAPLAVKLGIYLESLGNFRETEMSFDVDLYLYLSWKDSLVRHSKGNTTLVNDKKFLEGIWIPDLYFANARTAAFHDVMVPNFNMFIHSDGTIAYSTRVTLNVACNLDLMNYPLDHQVCLIKIISYAYIEKEMNVTWFSTDPIRYNPEIGLPEFAITTIRHDYCNGTFIYAISENGHKNDAFSCLLGIIQLDRAIGYHLVQSYIPTGLIVVISWVSFWIDRRAVPARVSLSFTTLLTLSTLGTGLRYALPPVSYAKAIDYWFGACMVFIFGALLEFAIVNSYMRRAHKLESHAQRLKWSIRTRTSKKLPAQMVNSNDLDIENSESETTNFDLRLNMNGKDKNHNTRPRSYATLLHQGYKCSRKGLYIDKTCRVLFPVTFLLFNMFYWSYYLLIRDEPEMISIKHA